MSPIKRATYQLILELTNDPSWQDDPWKEKQVQVLGKKVSEDEPEEEENDQKQNLNCLLPEEIEEAEAMYLNDQTLQEIANYFGVQAYAINKEMHRTGAYEKRLKARKKRDQKIHQMYEDGKPMQEIADKMGISICTIHGKVQAYRNSTRIQCVDPIGNITEFDSIHTLQKELGVSASGIYSHLDNDQLVKRGRFKGYTFYRTANRERASKELAEG